MKFGREALYHPRLLHNKLQNTGSPDPYVAQQWPNNLQNKYNTANAKAPTAFTGRH